VLDMGSNKEILASRVARAIDAHAIDCHPPHNAHGISAEGSSSGYLCLAGTTIYDRLVFYLDPTIAVNYRAGLGLFRA
jgi:hypothetical protein